MREIPLRLSTLVALVDDADYDRLAPYTWHLGTKVYRSGRVRHDARRRATVNGRSVTIYMHRDVLGVESPLHVDHINGDGLDNQRGNLRPCTPTQNNANREKRPGATSRYRGVCWCRATRSWAVDFGPVGSRVRVRGFRSEIDAARAYDERAPQVYGEFARLNFPNTGFAS